MRALALALILLTGCPSNSYTATVRPDGSISIDGQAEAVFDTLNTPQGKVSRMTIRPSKPVKFEDL